MLYLFKKYYFCAVNKNSKNGTDTKAQYRKHEKS